MTSSAGKLEGVRVLHVTAPARAGGLETVVCELAGAQRAHGHDAHVAAVLTPGTEQDHPFLRRLEAAAVPVHLLVLGTRDYLGERRAIRLLMEQTGADVLHTHGYRADVMDSGVARSLRRPHVMTLHGFVGGTRRGRFYEYLQVRAARKADGVVAVSSAIVERLRMDGTTASVQLLRNAVTPYADSLTVSQSRSALGLPADRTLVGWVGRVSAEKGPDVFVEALARAHPEIHGVIVGDGPALPSTLALADALGVRHRLHSCGMVPQASRYLRAFDVLALTSRTEGTPMILLEAMWAEVPIVATAVGGVPDVLSASEAMLCASEDAAALAEAMTRSALDTNHARVRAMAARTRVEAQFNPQNWVEQHVALYRRAMERSGYQQRA